MYDKEKLKHINPETLKLFQKYQVDMSIRDLSPNTINGYINDLQEMCEKPTPLGVGWIAQRYI